MERSPKDGGDHDIWDVAEAEKRNFTSAKACWPNTRDLMEVMLQYLSQLITVQFVITNECLSALHPRLLWLCYRITEDNMHCFETVWYYSLLTLEAISLVCTVVLHNCYIIFSSKWHLVWNFCVLSSATGRPVIQTDR
jgi:hypothetical protein